LPATDFIWTPWGKAE